MSPIESTFLHTDIPTCIYLRTLEARLVYTGLSLLFPPLMHTLSLEVCFLWLPRLVRNRSVSLVPYFLVAPPNKQVTHFSLESFRANHNGKTV